MNSVYIYQTILEGLIHEGTLRTVFSLKNSPQTVAPPFGTRRGNPIAEVGRYRRTSQMTAFRYGKSLTSSNLAISSGEPRHGSFSSSSRTNFSYLKSTPSQGNIHIRMSTETIDDMSERIARCVGPSNELGQRFGF